MQLAPADSRQLAREGLQALPQLLLLAGHHLELVLVQQLEGGRFLDGRGQQGQHFLHALLGDRVQLPHLLPHLLACRTLPGQQFLKGRFLRPQLGLLLRKGLYFCPVVELVFYVLSCLFLEDLQLFLIDLLALQGLLVNVDQFEMGGPLILDALLEGLYVAPEHLDMPLLLLE